MFVQQQVFVGSSSTATWSLIVGILGWFICPIIGGIVAVVLGHSALKEIRRNPAIGGSGQAIAGLILGYAHLAVYGGFVLLVLLGLCSTALITHR
ncbi:MAG: DUF4190 domain-containing protein [Candidatus Dormibacteraeota bacterium]|nr:DUF4190 domain-containing protein [Candidatus Dormibacteraeota bacterium]